MSPPVLFQVLIHGCKEWSPRLRMRALIKPQNWPALESVEKSREAAAGGGAVAYSMLSLLVLQSRFGDK